MRIAKADYFSGVFLTSILKAIDMKSTPVLLKAIGETKRIQFMTRNMGAFDVYVKYVTNGREMKRSDSYRWVFNFTDAEHRYLETAFREGSGDKLVVLVGTNKSLSSTRICVMYRDQVMRCLDNKSKNGCMQVRVTRIGSQHSFECCGYNRVTEARPDLNHAIYFGSYELDVVDEPDGPECEIASDSDLDLNMI